MEWEQQDQENPQEKDETKQKIPFQAKSRN